MGVDPPTGVAHPGTSYPVSSRCPRSQGLLANVDTSAHRLRICIELLEIRRSWLDRQSTRCESAILDVLRSIGRDDG
jgi:hypothetical protein